MTRARIGERILMPEARQVLAGRCENLQGRVSGWTHSEAIRRFRCFDSGMCLVGLEGLDDGLDNAILGPVRMVLSHLESRVDKLFHFSVRQELLIVA